jgi:hypothetical protein
MFISFLECVRAELDLVSLTFDSHDTTSVQGLDFVDWPMVLAIAPTAVPEDTMRVATVLAPQFQLRERHLPTFQQGHSSLPVHFPGRRQETPVTCGLILAGFSHLPIQRHIQIHLPCLHYSSVTRRRHPDSFTSRRLILATSQQVLINNCC